MNKHFITYEQVIRKTVKKTFTLLHCPFCGGGAEIKESGNYCHRLGKRRGILVQCKDCGIKTASKEKNGGEDAIKFWNTRVTE